MIQMMTYRRMMLSCRAILPNKNLLQSQKTKMHHPYRMNYLMTQYPKINQGRNHSNRSNRQMNMKKIMRYE